MKKLLVIADDLSGTYDLGMQMIKKGLNVFITDKCSDMGEVESCLFDSETRNMGDEEAYSVIKEFIYQINYYDYDFFYKKIDSTLRGNICAEIRALDDVICFDLIIIAPAYPALSRIVLNEMVFFDGVPITQTDLAMDPGCAVSKDNIRILLEEGLGKDVKHVDINELREDNYWLENGRQKIISFDSILDEDLDIIVSKYLRKSKKILWVGSIGLMQAILKHLYPTNATLSIAGSVSNVTREQILYAEEQGAEVIFIDVKEILNGKTTKGYIEDVVRNLKIGKDVIICTSRKRDDIISDVSGDSEKNSCEKILRCVNEILASITHDVLSRVAVEGILVTGGDTANNVINKISNKHPQIIDEILPSIPLTVLKTGEKEYLKIAIKSGHVGEKETMAYCIKKLKEKIKISKERGIV